MKDKTEKRLRSLCGVKPMTNDAWNKVKTARDPARPRAQDYLPLLFDHFVELHGDRQYGDDPSMIGGIAFFNGTPVTVLAQSKGHNLEENLKKHFGMNNPEGFRKAIRLARQAEKFKRPVITFVDTPGAYPGQGAEERGQAQAIASCLYAFSDLGVPVLCIVLSEGGSGGALALSVANRIVFLENAVFSILSPEGFASILWKDESLAPQAARAMKMTSWDLREAGFADSIILEPDWKDPDCLERIVKDLKKEISAFLHENRKKKPQAVIRERQEKIRAWGGLEWM